MFGIISIILGTIALCILLGAKKNNIPSVSGTDTFLIVAAAIAGLYFAPIGFDRMQYEMMFLHPGMWGGEKDAGWEVYNFIARFFLGRNSDLFFIVHDTIYTLLFVVFAKKIIPKNYRYYFLLLLFISMGYYSGGTNIMRSGLASALLFLGLSKYNKPLWFVLCSLLACSIHYSIGLTVVALVIGYYFPKIRLYLYIWIACVALSRIDALGGVLSTLTDIIGDTDGRLEGYTSQIGSESDLYKKTGWRIDFIIYSAIPLLFAYYYKVKSLFDNRFYDAVLSAYLLANSVWLCVIRMPFTDRIALLSWILIPIITIYPPLVDAGMKNRNIAAACAFIPSLALSLLYIIWL